MLPSNSVTAATASISFAAHAADNTETPNLQASLDALSAHFKSPVIVDGLPGAPIRPLGEESTLDTPDNLTHLIFYQSDEADHTSLMIHLVRNRQQLLIFQLTLPADDNLLFRGAATAALAVKHWNKDTLVASDADTLALRGTIESTLHPAMSRSVSLDSIAHAINAERASRAPRASLFPSFDPNAERDAAIANFRAATHIEFQLSGSMSLGSVHSGMEERITYENGMRRLTPSPEPVTPPPQLAPRATKRPFPF